MSLYRDLLIVCLMNSMYGGMRVFVYVQCYATLWKKLLCTEKGVEH